MEPSNPLSRLADIDARRICVIKPSALGDVVQTLPLLSALRIRFPQARISWVINRPLAPLLEGHPDLDEIIPFDRRGSLRTSRRLLKKLHRCRFDLVFDLQGLFRTAVMTLATRAAIRVGLESAREGSKWGAHFAVPRTGPNVPPHMRYRRVADALGLSDLPLEGRLAIGRSETQWAREELARLPGPVLAVHPGASWVTKRWPPERFAAVACKAVRRFGLSIAILGIADEAPLGLEVETTARRLAPNVPLANLAGRTSLKQLAALLQQSAALLTNDSGPMQLAAHFGTPIVGVFTCTSPQLSGPPDRKHELVATHVRCAASYHKRCPYPGRKHMLCMEELDVDRVWSAFCRMMQKNFPQSEAA
jgi:heptosyltransferase I